MFEFLSALSVGTTIAIAVLALALFVGACFMIRNMVRSINDFLHERRVQQRTPFNCHVELQRFVRRVLAREKWHEGKIYLISLVFGGAMPIELRYRAMNRLPSPRMGLLNDAEMNTVRRVTDGNSIGTLRDDLFCWIISVNAPSRLIPQFTLADGTTFVLCGADRGDISIDFDTRRVKGELAFHKPLQPTYARERERSVV